MKVIVVCASVYVIYFVNLALCDNIKNEWIDPHEIKFGSIDVTESSEENSLMQDYEIQSSVDSNQEPTIVYYKRLVNMLLSRSFIENSGVLEGHLFIDITEENYNYLKQFTKFNSGDSSELLEKLRRVDDIISYSLKQSQKEYFTEVFKSWNDWFIYILYNGALFIFGSCILVLYISYKLLRKRLTVWSVVKYILLFAWIIDFGFTWMLLLEENEINRVVGTIKHSGSVPSSCHPEKMNTLQYIWSFFSSTDECKEYHKLIFKSTMWSVSPLTVISYQAGIVIYTPAQHFGQALGSFSSGISSSLPWYTNVFLLPLLLIISAILICIFLAFITQTTFSINVFHILSLKFGSEQRRVLEDIIQGHHLGSLLDAAQRNVIQDVRPVNNESNSTRKTDVKCDCSANKQSCCAIKDQSVDAEKSTTSKLCEKVVSTDNIEENVEIVENNQQEPEKCQTTSKNDGSGDAK